MAATIQRHPTRAQLGFAQRSEHDSDHVLDQDGILERGLNFLPKPITPNALTQAVRSILDAKRS